MRHNERSAGNGAAEHNDRPVAGAALLDALTAHIAILDTNGTIIAVNAAWHHFTVANDILGAAAALRLNYLAICDEAAAAGNDAASVVAVGLRTLLSGRQEVYAHEYRCQGLTGDRWVALRAVRVVVEGLTCVVIAHEDVTAHRQAEALGVTQTQLLDQVEAAVIATNPAGMVTYWNAYATVLYGWAADEVLGQPIGALAVDPVDPAATALIWARLRAGESWAGEFIARRKDGTTFPAQVTDGPLRDADGRLMGVVGVSLDITARRAIEAALQASEERFRSAFDHAAIGMALIAPDGRWLQTNSAFRALVGYPADELAATIVQELTHPDDLATDAAYARQLLAGEIATYQTEKRYLHRDGHPVWALVSASLLRDERGQPLHYIAQMQDLTARKAAEAAVIASEARYRRLFAEAERQARELVLLDRVRTALAAQLSEHDIIRTVTATLAEDLGYTRQGIYLREGDRLVGESYIDHSYRPQAFLLSAGLLGRVARTRRAELVTDIASDPDFSEAQRQNGAAIAAPLLDGMELLGILNVESAAGGTLGEADLRLLTALAEQVGIALGRARRLAALRASEAGLAEAQRIAQLGSWEYHIAADRLTWSDEVFRILGHPPQSFIPTQERLLAAIHPDDRAQVTLARANGLTDGPTYEVEHRIVRPDGQVRMVHQWTEIVRDAEGRPQKRQGVIQDVTERWSLEEQLRHRATHDTLTGLPNRDLFLARLAQILVPPRHEGDTTAVLFLDLDRFKDINDTLGHDTGDALLMAATKRLQGALRAGDTLARFGGDEFAVLLTALRDPAEAEHLADHLLKALALAQDDNDSLTITASAGLVTGLTGYARPEDVLRDADVAMYRAKAAGKGRYALFDAAMQAQLVTLLKLEWELRRALEQRELTLHYQPIIDLHTGGIATVEALARWPHTTRGMVPPGVFIPLAEETGLIVPLGRWVLAEACRQAAAWVAEGRAVAVAINLTAQEFQRPGLTEQVAEALAMAGLDARWLRLEITESLAMRDVTATITTLTALGALGIQVAIDDFGTGYSSLAYLKRLPVVALKIDKAFVDGIGAAEEDTAIVAAIVTLAHTLGLRVVAEGVETALQAERLRQLGCDAAQGYHFARPLPPEKVAALLVHNAPPAPQQNL